MRPPSCIDGEFGEAQGVEIRTGAAVDRVIVEGGVAAGVRLADGEEVRSPIVVSNADPKNTYLNLVATGDLDHEFTDRIRNLGTNVCSMKFLAALNDLPDFSAYLGEGYDRSSVVSMKISPSMEYTRRSWRDAEDGKVPMNPIMWINFPSIVDDSVAPAGNHVMTNWMEYVPWELEGTTWSEARQQVGERVIDILTEYAPNFRDCLID